MCTRKKNTLSLSQNAIRMSPVLFIIIFQLPSDDVKEILEKMSRLKARSGWEFMYDYDREFCERSVFLFHANMIEIVPPLTL